MNVLFVGGSFDDNGGRPSSIVSKFANEIQSVNIGTYTSVTLYNGGYFSDIEHIIERCAEHDVVFWWANVPNDKPKIRDVKSVNNRVMLVTSKRNDNDKYSFAELINRALGTKANLCIEFKRINDKYQFMLFDPLGNSWYKGFDIKECANVMMCRLVFLSGITRQGCVHSDVEVSVPDETEFFDVIKKHAETFHELINPEPNVTRFLGNSSFRCMRGFPSFKRDGVVFVSKRNVDKRFIDKDNFVPTWFEDSCIMYAGEHKPSVDTPIQLRLYDMLPNINYMIHAHVYIKDAPYTLRMVPCGGLQEVNEILFAIKSNYESMDQDFYAINLIGHGCIVMSDDVEKLKNLDYVGRVLPEQW